MAGILYATVIPGQQNVTTAAVLASARQDPAVVYHAGHLTFLSQTNQRLPLPEQISLRTETDRFELRRQEYLARLSVNGLNEIRHQRQLNDAQYQSEENKQLLYWHEALKSRYTALARCYFLEKKLALQHALQLVYDDRLTVLKKLASLNLGMDVDELIRVEYDRDETMMDIAASQGNLDALKINLASWLGNDPQGWQLDTTLFIGLDQAAALIDQVVGTTPLNPRVLEKQADINTLQEEYSLEKARAGQIMDFIQVRYANQPGAPIGRDLSVGIGLTLPYKGSSRPKMNAIRIDQNEAESELMTYLYEVNWQISEARTQIASLRQQYALSLEQWAGSQARFTLEQSSTAQSDGPLTLLRAKEVEIRHQFILLGLQEDIVTRYLKILDLTGALSASPAVNYLSASLESY